MSQDDIRAEREAIEKCVAAMEGLRIDLWDRLTHLRRVVCGHPEWKPSDTDPRLWQCADCGYVGESKD